MEEKMTRRSWMRSSLTTLASLAAASSLPIHLKGNIVPAVIPLKGGTNQNRSKVLMTKEISPDALVKIYEALKRKASGRVAIKISTGEPGGHNFLQPSLIKDLVQKVSGTIVECNTAYVGKRFKKHIQYNIVGTHLKNYDFMINLAHFKGHAMGGFGGVIKNQSIGVASSKGKTYIHTAGKTAETAELWNNLPEQDAFLESMAASAQSVADYFGDNILYINVMNNLSIDCDCDSNPHDPEMKDIGILASTDPVALDQACLDLVYAVKPTEGNDNRPLVNRIESLHGRHTVDYAETIGLGSKNYELVVLDT